ncbi:MAG: NTP transferase domain-containing protein [Myxococcota bacterium]
MSGATVAIVPVRGGSVGIPRKNARLLCGKPLLAYCLEAARAARSIDALYVSTDDPELAEIARRFGAEVLERPAALAGPDSTLDEVIVDAVPRIEASGTPVGHVVTLQATSPLLRPATIDRAVAACREQALDTVLSVVDARHLHWTQTQNGDFSPLYAARVNRQQLPAQFRETGGVVVCRREILDTGSRFGTRVSAVELGATESLDIDDRFDWWLAEKSLQRRRIAFRVVGNRETGLGHAYRALTLADRLIDHELHFFVRPDHGLAAQRIETRRHPVHVVGQSEELEALRACAPDLIVNDVLDTTKREMEAFRSLGAAVVNFEDLGPGAALADAVVNALYDVPGGGFDGNVHQGVSHCVLRDEFYSVEPIAVREDVREVLVLFGGTDPNDLTARCLPWIDALPGDWRLTVVSGFGYPRPEALRAIAADLRHDTEVVVDTPIVSRYMARADIAITSAGRTVFELASLGVPMLVIPQNARECQHRFALESPGVVSLPPAHDLDPLEFSGALHELLSDHALRQQLHTALLAADIRGGIDRTLDVLEGALRVAPKPRERQEPV